MQRAMRNPAGYDTYDTKDKTVRKKRYVLGGISKKSLNLCFRKQPHGIQ